MDNQHRVWNSCYSVLGDLPSPFIQHIQSLLTGTRILKNHSGFRSSFRPYNPGYGRTLKKSNFMLYGKILNNVC
jgi:hypothetical protein